MDSHENQDHGMRQRLHDALNAEEPLSEYQAANEVHVRRLPPDPHGLIRISVGGGDNLPIRCNYLVFRGNPKQTIQLLRKALTALEEGF